MAARTGPGFRPRGRRGQQRKRRLAEREAVKHRRLARLGTAATNSSVPI
jgi:hypothetical protein